ncbi:hypothetical protein CONCODRAFT_7860 [Conidiobolus coronatus NRRL 28638]|uniref:Ras-GEF domain-containing protein n=1 Tax=Conidiobolus coronatus (strain ATCC 28846 / CBS 209.66 / NRRL 28638) TaxID=796925 RepID=A0A137P3V0_CONC2|nr:hypothetical protein CONCODRAFT_7860 [Conidiobolus coronatus NRRL 28638]|eukprot:KXN69702.1 hypothetical protein CONCODRAFT_7860 [Conidiobolus coronatus NRRL 28638]
MNIQDELLKADHYFNNNKLREAFNSYIQISETILYRIKDETNIIESNEILSRPINTKFILDSLSHCHKQIQNLLIEKEFEQGQVKDDQVANKYQNEHSQFSEILIPFSPLYKLITINKQAYEVAKERIQAAKRQNSEFSIEAWRRLAEDFRLQRKNWEDVTKQISSASKISMMSIDVALFAKNLTQLDSMLFQKVELQSPIKFLSNNAQSNYALACAHFQLYITSVVTHCIITAGYHPHPTHLQRAHTIQYFIRLAHHLLIQYRNFNSFSAVIQALNSPQVKRLNQVWDLVPQKYCDRLNEYLKLTSEQDRYHFYFMELNQRIEHCQYFGSALLVIPWMHPHFTDGQSIYSNHGSNSASDPSEITLSEYALLFCKPFQSGRASPTMSIGGMSSSTNFSRFRSSRMAADIESHLPPLKLPSNLSSLGEQNIQISHWILTRVKPTQAQLWELSHKVQSASPEDLRKELPLPNTNPEPHSDSLSSSFSLDLDVSNAEIFTGDGKSPDLSSISGESLGADDNILEDLGDEAKIESDSNQDNQNLAKSFLDLRNTPSPIPPPAIDGYSFLNQENPWQAEKPNSNINNYTNGDVNERSLSCSDSLKFETFSQRESNSSPQDFKRASPISSPSLGSSYFHANNLNQLSAFFQNKKESSNHENPLKSEPVIASNELKGSNDDQNEKDHLGTSKKESSQDQNLSAFVQDFESIYNHDEQPSQDKQLENGNVVNAENNDNHIDLPSTTFDENKGEVVDQLNQEAKQEEGAEIENEMHQKKSTTANQIAELENEKKNETPSKELINGISAEQHPELLDNSCSLDEACDENLHVDPAAKNEGGSSIDIDKEHLVNENLQQYEAKEAEKEVLETAEPSENIEHYSKPNGDTEHKQNGFRDSKSQIEDQLQNKAYSEEAQQSSILESSKAESSDGKDNLQNHTKSQVNGSDHSISIIDNAEEKEASQNEDDLMEQGLLSTRKSSTEEKSSSSKIGFKFNPKAQTFVPKSTNNNSFTKSDTSDILESPKIQPVNKNILELEHSTSDDISKAFPIPSNNQDELDKYISNNPYVQTYPTVVTVNQAPQFNGNSERETQSELAPEQQKFASTLSLLKKSNRNLAAPPPNSDLNDQNDKDIVSDLVVKLINPELLSTNQDSQSSTEPKSSKLPSTLSSLKKKSPIFSSDPLSNNLENSQQQSPNQHVTHKSEQSLPNSTEITKKDQNEDNENPQIVRKSLSSLPSKNSTSTDTKLNDSVTNNNNGNDNNLSLNMSSIYNYDNLVPSNVKQIYSLVSSNLKSPTSHIDDEFNDALKQSDELNNNDNSFIESSASDNPLNGPIEYDNEVIEPASNDTNQSNLTNDQSTGNPDINNSELDRAIESPKLDDSMENTPDLVGITPIHSPESGSVRSQSDTLVTPRLELDSISAPFQDFNRPNKSTNLPQSVNHHHHHRANKAPFKWDEDFEGTESLNSISPRSERFDINATQPQATPLGPRINEDDTIEYFSFQAYKAGANPIQKIFKFGLRNPKPSNIQQFKSQTDNLNQVFVPYHHLGFNPNLHNNAFNNPNGVDYSGQIRNGYDRSAQPQLMHEYSYKNKSQKA